MKKINRLLITMGSALGIGAVAIPVIGACSAGSVVLKLSTTGFDINKIIQPLNYTGNNSEQIQTAQQGLKAWNELSNKNKTTDLVSTIFRAGTMINPYLKNDFFDINFKKNKWQYKPDVTYVTYTHGHGAPSQERIVKADTYLWSVNMTLNVYPFIPSFSYVEKMSGSDTESITVTVPAIKSISVAVDNFPLWMGMNSTTESVEVDDLFSQAQIPIRPSQYLNRFNTFSFYNWGWTDPDIEALGIPIGNEGVQGSIIAAKSKTSDLKVSVKTADNKTIKAVINSKLAHYSLLQMAYYEGNGSTSKSTKETSMPNSFLGDGKFYASVLSYLMAGDASEDYPEGDDNQKDISEWLTPSRIPYCVPSYYLQNGFYIHKSPFSS